MGPLNHNSASLSGVVRESLQSVTICGTYRLLQRIGSGAMGDVYEAEHVRLGKLVAVKVLRAQSTPRVAERFAREMRLLSQIDSEFVVTSFDGGTSDVGPFLVMELLHGRDLRRLLEDEPVLAACRVVRLALDAGQGLAAIHDAGLVHRDLKPENLFVSTRGTGGERCKILDLGIAKVLTSNITAHGAVVGTTRYMAPEQVMDGSAASPRADIYSLGAVLYECLTGMPLHPGRNMQEIMFSILNRQPKTLMGYPGVPHALARVVMRAVAHDARDRFQSAQEFVGALRRCLSDTTPFEVTEAEAVPTSRPKVRTPVQRSALGVLVLLSSVSSSSGLPVKEPRSSTSVHLSSEGPHCRARGAGNQHQARELGLSARANGAPARTPPATITPSARRSQDGKLKMFDEPGLQGGPGVKKSMRRPMARGDDWQSTGSLDLVQENPYSQRTR